MSEAPDSSAAAAIGTRWVEPVLLGTNPVIVHPNALADPSGNVDSTPAIRVFRTAGTV